MEIATPPSAKPGKIRRFCTDDSKLNNRSAESAKISSLKTWIRIEEMKKQQQRCERSGIERHLISLQNEAT